MKKKKRTSLDNAFEILKLFSLDEPEMSVTEIAQRLDVSKSTAHRLLSSLLAEEFVYQNPKNNLYSLGSSILGLVNIVNSQIHISQESIPVLNTIAEQTRESAHLSIMEDAETIVYIQTVQGMYGNGAKGGSRLGMRRAMTESASGKVFLAYDKQLLDERAPADPSLVKELALVEKNGYCIVDINKTTEIAVPVFFNKEITAALSITANKKRIRSERLQKQAIRHLEHAANKLETIIANRKKGDSIATN